jgi:formiminoglutamate deiminase
MAEALRAAAAEAGVRLTLLDTLYLWPGFDSSVELEPVQLRFSDGDVERWAIRVEKLRSGWSGDPLVRVGTAVHSVRAVDPDSIAEAAVFSSRTEAPLHIHMSEQPAENAACRVAHGCSPAELLAGAGALGPRTTAVHATHVTDADRALLAASGSAVCLCPTTERDLADGIGPARALAERGIPLAFGSDSHAVIDLFEEARAAELDERLTSGTRGGLAAESLLAAASAGGAAAVGWPDTGRLAAGALADFVTVGLDSLRLAGAASDELIAAVVFAATAADVAEVVVGGRTVVRSGTHALLDDVPGQLSDAVAALDQDQPS